MGKREEKKKHYRMKIIEASRAVFKTHGFENTTIEMIAAEAEIGLGTAYNYFKSKEELFILSMAEEAADNSEAESQNVIFEGEPSDIVTDTVLKYIKRMNWVNKNIWRVAFPIILKGMNPKKMTIEEIFRADFRMKEQIIDVMKMLKAEGRLDEGFEPEVAAEIIFSILIYQVAYFVYSDTLSYEQMEEKIRAQIAFMMR